MAWGRALDEFDVVSGVSALSASGCLRRGCNGRDSTDRSVTHASDIMSACGSSASGELSNVVAIIVKADDRNGVGSVDVRRMNNSGGTRSSTASY